MAYKLDTQMAACEGKPVNLFFEYYENSPSCAVVVDSICNSCPIQRECLATGVSFGACGVWGGIYLEDGDISEEHNLHKTKEDWDSLWLQLTTTQKT
jgi:Transcription factor WhiB